MSTSTAVASATLRQRLDALPDLATLAKGRGGVVAGVPSGSIGLIAWWLRETTKRTILVVSSESERVYADSLVWSGGGGSAIFPAGDTPPFDRVPPSEEVTRARLATLMRLHSRAEPLLVVASPRGLLRPTLSRTVVEAGLTEVKRGARLPRDVLVGRLVELGYRRESAVSVPGDFAVRGGIVDVFGVDRARPWRAEWFGDDVEDIRAFDPATQELIAKLEAAQVWPARELDLTPASVARALELVARLDAGALRDDVREQWESDSDLLQSGVYEEGLDLFFPYLGGEPAATLLDHLDDPIVLLDGGRERLIAAAERHVEEIENLRVQEEDRGELPHGAATGLVDIEVLLRRLTPSPDSSWCARRRKMRGLSPTSAGVESTATSAGSTLSCARRSSSARGHAACWWCRGSGTESRSSPQSTAPTPWTQATSTPSPRRCRVARSWSRQRT